MFEAEKEEEGEREKKRHPPRTLFSLTQFLKVELSRDKKTGEKEGEKREEAFVEGEEVVMEVKEVEDITIVPEYFVDVVMSGFSVLLKEREEILFELPLMKRVAMSAKTKREEEEREEEVSAFGLIMREERRRREEPEQEKRE